jgi:WD40 repeat protein
MGKMKSKKISIPGQAKNTILTFSNVKHAASKTCFAGCSDGQVYALSGSSVSGKPTPCHTKPILALNVVKQTGSQSEQLITGSFDGTIKIHDIKGSALAVTHTIQVDSVPRSVDLLDNKLLAGMKNGCIVQMPVGAGQQATPMTVN